MLILLPPSDRKRSVGRGKRLDPAGLSFPQLAPTRSAVLEALIEVSAEPERHAGSGNGRVCAMSFATTSTFARRPPPLRRPSTWASCTTPSGWPTSTRRHGAGRGAWIAIVSALWGAVRPGDRIPPYRLDMCGRLPGLAHLPTVWKDRWTKCCPPRPDATPNLGGCDDVGVRRSTKQPAADDVD